MADKTREERLRSLVSTLNISGEIDYDSLNTALTHPSYFYEGTGKNSAEHNQRLEFLGDAVVGLVIAQYLYENYSEKTEGELTRMRAAVVCESSLAKCAQKMDLGDYLLLGKGEELMGGAERTSNLADCFEAFIGALYLSLGLSGIRPFIIAMLKDRIKEAESGRFTDFKTQLQENIQRERENKLHYHIISEEGPDHEKIFEAAVYLNEIELARGKGKTKKEAEQKAAKLALKKTGAKK